MAGKFIIEQLAVIFIMDVERGPCPYMGYQPGLM